MKIGVIADTHIPRRAKSIPKEVFRYFKGVDLILHAGDLTDLSVVDELRSITPNVEVVLGNMDPSENQSVLPVKKLINEAGVKIGLIHGWGPPMGLRKRVWNELKKDRPDVVIFAHSHQPEKVVSDGVLFLNPGTPTDKCFTSVNTIALLTIKDGKPEAEIIKL